MLEMNKTSFEEILARDGRLFYTNIGDSMMPLIKQGRDLLVIEKKPGSRKNMIYRCISAITDSMCCTGF